MLPDFALNFSSAGMELFHRGTPVWNSLGKAEFSSPDFTADVAAMREKAEALAPAPVAVKLVLPDEQVRFLSIRNTASSPDEEEILIRQSLSGATPYPVEALAFSWMAPGPSLEIAAVPLDTLHEAQRFAEQHGFLPLAFVTSAQAQGFTSEPFFGAVSGNVTLPSAVMPEDRTVRFSTAPAQSPAPQTSIASLISTDHPGMEQDHIDNQTVPTVPETEADHLTNFGARQTDKPKWRKYLGLILSIILLLFMFAVAAWAVASQGYLEGIFGNRRSADPAPSATQAISHDGSSTRMSASENEATPRQDPSPDAVMPEAAKDPTAPGSPPKTSYDQAPIAGLSVPSEPREPATPAEAAARYAATGIWLRAPVQSNAPVASAVAQIDVDTVSEVDRVPAIDSPRPEIMGQGSGFQTPPTPPAPDQTFDLDDRGLVRATPEGAKTPAGHLVFLGRPPVVPPQRQPATAGETPQADRTSEAQPETTGAAAKREGNEAGRIEDAVAAAISEVRPKARPEDLVSDDELEPEDDGGTEQAMDSGDDTDPKFADALSVRPKARPAGFNTIVAAAQALATTTQAPAAPAQTTMTPSFPSAASVAREATEKRAIDLSDINLIGVTGKPSDRTAMIRMSNGRIITVKVGDRLDGGRVAAIGDKELHYVKSNRTLVLNMPEG